MRVKIWPLIKESVSGFISVSAPRLAAATAFYAMLSLAPLLVAAVAAAAIFFGPAAARGELTSQMGRHIGPEAAKLVQDVLQNSQQDSSGPLAVALGAALLLVGASAVFRVMQEAMDVIWEVQAKPRKALLSFILQRLASFLMILVLGGLVVASMASTSLLQALRSLLPASTSPVAAVLWKVAGYAVQLALLTLLVALTFKVLPDARVTWRDASLGAFITGVLILVGNFGIAMYLSRASTTTAYGAAGSLAIMLLWIYYTMMIFYFGAQVTHIYARQAGRGIVPRKHAVKLEPPPSEQPAH
ncbi:MAG: YihY/virulence factor BrkB family protein [Planctomycetaceae bacterium]|nr:YihY/virulence factor BrkB family protein [Planctomycetaceae bacterium]